jgi:Zn finger protein HypA/HybF involved in hydrogenase expression
MKCDYGCNEEAKFKLKNGKNCCNSSANKCAGMRAKNSNGLKGAYKEGKKEITFNNKHRERSILTKKEKAKNRFLTTNSNLSNHAIKKILLETLNHEDKCDECGISDWHGSKLTLQLDHIDGNNSNNEISNLRLLCPNCHSLTDTYCGKSINTGKLKVSDEELIKAIESSKNIRQALISVNLTPKGANYARAYKLSALKET